MERRDIGHLPVRQLRLPQFPGWILIKTAHRAYLLRRDVQSGDKAFPTPKLYIVISDKALGLRDCRGIVGANQRLESHEVPVVPNEGILLSRGLLRDH